MADKSFNLIGRNLMIAIPCYDGKVNIRTAFAIAELVPKLDKMGVRLNLVHVSGCSIITKARNKLVRKFMESDCTDFLFVDADVVINTDAVTRLLALSSDKDVVAGVETWGIVTGVSSSCKGVGLKLFTWSSLILVAVNFS